MAEEAIKKYHQGDYETARRLWCALAGAGSYLAYRYMTSPDWPHHDLETSARKRQELDKEAERMSAMAFFVGLCYYIGNNGYQRDYTKAYYYLKIAESKNHMYAKFQLGTLHILHQKLDYKIGLDMVKEAAERGIASAQHQLGMYMEHGI